jgi:hypothetical protein
MDPDPLEIDPAAIAAWEAETDAALAVWAAATEGIDLEALLPSTEALAAALDGYDLSAAVAELDRALEGLELVESWDGVCSYVCESMDGATAQARAPEVA